eukprot:m.1119518 g.1119518  ORF g.1119518 m.1119518 type:complete len:320 (+) comp24391_c0_seq11:893-1852(+)
MSPDPCNWHGNRAGIGRHVQVTPQRSSSSIGAYTVANNRSVEELEDVHRATQRLAVAFAQRVPDAPDGLPRHVPHPVDERVLQPVGAHHRPALADLRHVPRLKHTRARHERRTQPRDVRRHGGGDVDHTATAVVACVAPRWQVSPVVPAHRVPRQCLAVCKGVLRGAVAGKQAAVIGAALGLRGKRPPAARHRSLVERTVDAKHRVAVEPVGAHRLDNLCQHRHVIVHRPVRTRVPGVVRQQHAHVGGVELRNQVGEARETTTGECVQHVELRAVVHPDVRVRMPQQHRVHAAVASPCIREPRAHSPPSGAAIEEKAIV